jgi:5-formyltetrahydrofolate cyclo-ligase|tara:strand:- start:27 stop:569 length:543 start_codon:yes stop_codon:yes gene_type:complete
VNKSEIRQKILKIRKQNSFKDYVIDSNRILKFLKKNKIKGKTIGGYYPYNYELNIMPILENFEKKNFLISLPKIRKNSQMDFFYWSTKDPLNINKYGIPEPKSSKVRYPDILLVPLVAFDKDFNRVGYGGGFYDRYIKKIKKIKKLITIGLAYSFQKVKKISINENDIQLDFVITEKQKL